MRRCSWICSRILIGLAGLTLVARSASAQVTPAAGYTPPDDTPSIKVGVTFYGDYTYTQNPQATDADGNTINPDPPAHSSRGRRLSRSRLRALIYPQQSLSTRSCCYSFLRRSIGKNLLRV